MGRRLQSRGCVGGHPAAPLLQRAHGLGGARLSSLQNLFPPFGTSKCKFRSMALGKSGGETSHSCCCRRKCARLGHVCSACCCAARPFGNPSRLKPNPSAGEGRQLLVAGPGSARKVRRRAERVWRGAVRHRGRRRRRNRSPARHRPCCFVPPPALTPAFRAASLTLVKGARCCFRHVCKWRQPHAPP